MAGIKLSYCVAKRNLIKGEQKGFITWQRSCCSRVAVQPPAPDSLSPARAANGGSWGAGSPKPAPSHRCLPLLCSHAVSSPLTPPAPLLAPGAGHSRPPPAPPRVPWPQPGRAAQGFVSSRRPPSGQPFPGTGARLPLVIFLNASGTRSAFPPHAQDDFLRY